MADDAVATMIANLERNTGRSFDAWLALARDTGIAKPKALLDHLKTNHGLTHGYANLVALKALKADAGSSDEGALEAQMFAGGREAVRPIHEKVIAYSLGLGPDVELAPKKGYVSLRRKKQFACAHPSTKDRFDLGLILKGVEPHGRLEKAGSWNAMVTHRVRITDVSQIDAEVEGWLRQAYEAAG